MDDVVPIIIAISMLITGIVFGCLGAKTGKTLVVDEMNKYGSVRIDGATYILEEMINNDK